MQSTVGFASFVLAQTSPPPVDGTAPLSVGSIWDFIVKGGPTMAVIVICSLMALTVIVERLLVLRRRSVVPPDFLAALPGLAGDRTRALDYCRANGSPIAMILAAVFQRRGESIEAVEKAVQDAGLREMVRLRHRMRLLSVLPQVATMLGLLGTIFGMIKTFQAVAATGQSLGKTEMLAKGIFEAWTNTAAGLIVAIPVLVAYQMLMGKIDATAVALDRIAVDWIERERGAISLMESSRDSVLRSSNGERTSVAPAALAPPAPIPAAV